MESWSTSSSKSGSAVLDGNRVSGVLQSAFFGRDTLLVARELLGKLLIVRSDPRARLSSPRAGVTIGRIVETEGYHGEDPASHSARGETPRSSIMFGDPGLAYVYFIYGMYEMLNFVTEPKGYPGAVLIRAIEPIAGLDLMMKRRPGSALSQLTNGPGKLCRAMGIRMDHRGQGLAGPSLYVADDGFIPARILASPRVGISQARDRLWRYAIDGNPFVSKVRENSLAVPFIRAGAIKPGRLRRAR